VQVGGPGKDVRGAVQGAEEVQHVLDVAAELSHRVQHRPRPVGRLDDELGFVLEQGGLRPLLELDDDVGRATPARVLAGEHDVDPLAGQWQLVLHQYLHAAELCLLEVGGERGEAGVPGTPLGLGRGAVVLMGHLGGQSRPETSGSGEVGESGGGRTKQWQGPVPGEHESTCGWGHVRGPEASRAATSTLDAAPPGSRNQRRWVTGNLVTRPYDTFAAWKTSAGKACDSSHRIRMGRSPVWET
jgi:hypothetical protein